MGKRYFVLNNANLKTYNSMRLDAVAADLIVPACADGAAEAFDDYAGRGVIIVGNGSNIIFSKRRYETPILVTQMLNSIEFRDGVIHADAGVSLSRVAWFAAEHHVEGFEYLEDIPGSIGGALYMNAGTNEGSVGNLIVSATVYDPGKRQTLTLGEAELSSSWGYRDSYFRYNPCFIISCGLRADRLNARGYGAILEKMLSTKMKRYMKQPRNFPSAGSVFKRPYVNGEPRYIWKLFDEAGLRGYRIGDAQVSEKHPGFIINRGAATGEDILRLLNHCKETVKDRCGIILEEEWKIL